MGNRTNIKRFAYNRRYISVNPLTGPAAPVLINENVVLNNRRVGVDDPHYMDKIKRGSSATNPYKRYKYDIVYKAGGLRIKLNWPGVPFDGAIGESNVIIGLPNFYDSPTPSLLADAENRAAIGIRKRISEEQQSFSGLTMLGELRETVHMIRHPAESLRMFCNEYFTTLYSKKRRMNRKRFGTVLADSWLEFCFGLAPMMSDITSLAEALLPVFSEPRIKRIQYTGYAEAATSSVGTNGYAGIGVVGTLMGYVSEEVSCRYTVGYRIKREGVLTPLQRLVDLGGFNLTEIIPTAWELLPWSFFIDYFSNIGNVISTNLVSLEDIAWTRRNVRMTRKNLTVSPVHAATARDTHYTILPNSETTFVQATVTVFERDAAVIPFSELRFALPGRNNQFFNMAALAQGQFVPPTLRKK